MAVAISKSQLPENRYANEVPTPPVHSPYTEAVKYFGLSLVEMDTNGQLKKPHNYTDCNLLIRFAQIQVKCLILRFIFLSVEFVTI